MISKTDLAPVTEYKMALGRVLSVYLDVDQAHAENLNRKFELAFESKIKDLGFPEFRRAAADISIQSGLGLFFAAKFRAATLFGIYERSKYVPALERALGLYRKARAAWGSFATEAKPIYRSDVTFGPEYFQRDHWLDRLEAIADIGAPNYALAEYKAPENFKASDCPLCAAQVPITRF